MSTFDRAWLVAPHHEGGYMVIIKDADTPHQSIHAVARIAFTLEDGERVAKAVAQVPAMMAILAKLESDEAKTILAAIG